MTNHNSAVDNKLASWPVYPVLCYACLITGILGLSRLLLVLWQFDRVETFDNAFTVLAYGIRFDFIIVCFIALVPALLLPLLSGAGWFNRLIIRFSKWWFALATMLVVFLEINTPAFIDQFDTRPNRIYFEYLETPSEILQTAIFEYPWHFVVAVVLMVLLVWFLSVFNRRIFSHIEPWPLFLRLGMLPVIFFICLAGMRSSFDHRAANPSTAAFTNDQLVNKLGLSSIYSVLYAYYSLANEESPASMYSEMPVDRMMKLVRKQMKPDPIRFSDEVNSTRHLQLSEKSPTNANLVIILEESMGAGFVGKLGGIGVTPELDKIAEEGMWFTNLYATGTRSARGLEAIISGFPPSPSRSVLKLGLAQQDFTTLASILRQHHYESHFIYGGESHFDNMAGFFLANGFDRVTDENDYPEASFRGTWGVSDEDLFERLDQSLMAQTGKPKFILAFTSSNHAPFEFPDNKITLYDATKATVSNAIKYADFALGQYISRAKNQPYWNNTYFLIVADHDTRVFGASLLPVDKFHIPALILGPDIEPANYTRVASQIDLAPTLLDILGIDAEHPMIGHSLLKLEQNFRGRAIMQYGNNHAYMLGDQVVIHAPRKPAKQFVFEHGLKEVDIDPELVEVALAHALWSSYAYREKKYSTGLIIK